MILFKKSNKQSIPSPKPSLNPPSSCTLPSEYRNPPSFLVPATQSSPLQPFKQQKPTLTRSISVQHIAYQPSLDENLVPPKLPDIAQYYPQLESQSNHQLASYKNSTPNLHTLHKAKSSHTLGHQATQASLRSNMSSTTVHSIQTNVSGNSQKPQPLVRKSHLNKKLPPLPPNMDEMMPSKNSTIGSSKSTSNLKVPPPRPLRPSNSFNQLPPADFRLRHYNSSSPTIPSQATTPVNQEFKIYGSDTPRSQRSTRSRRALKYSTSHAQLSSKSSQSQTNIQNPFYSTINLLDSAIHDQETSVLGKPSIPPKSISRSMTVNNKQAGFSLRKYSDFSAQPSPINLRTISYGNNENSANPFSPTEVCIYFSSFQSFPSFHLFITCF